ncbi:MAG: ATP-binding protein [Chloroflexota bacterium]|nr:ATP-binding protein [Chloroflexota bacterium]
MEDQELGEMLAGIESYRAERTISTTNTDKFCEAICAFANDFPIHQKPGVLFIGAGDDGSCGNITVTDQLLLSLADLRSNGNITRFPAMQVQKRSLLGCEMVVIIVHPSDDPPVRYRGRTWIRVGPRRAVATPEEERQSATRI